MVTLAAAPHAAPAIRPPVQPSSWRLGGLSVSRGAQPAWATPCDGDLLLIPVGQPLCLRQPHLPQNLQPPADLLYLPAGQSVCRVAAFEGWRLELDSEQLCRRAAELSEHRLSPARCHRRLQSALPLQLRLPAERALQSALLQMLQISETSTLRLEGQLELLRLDTMIERLVALLLCGDLIQAARQLTESDPGHRHRVFEALLDWIRTHLDQPIQLQDLVRQSGYSQRSLRNFFRERFGCGPAHWIRNQRLQLARERLLNPQPQDTVSAIAAALGYEHPSQFSRDFQQAFGSRPSALLREGRRSHGPD